MCGAGKHSKSGKGDLKHAIFEYLYEDLKRDCALVESDGLVLLHYPLQYEDDA